MLEVCVDSLESAVNAVKGGADELELCSALSDGGLTPSVGLVKQVINIVNSQCKNNSRTKINVMLRCRGGDDFIYSDLEMDTMIADLQVFKQLGVDRFVFGALTNNRMIDEKNCSNIIKEAHPLPVTFHRAFDLCQNPTLCLETIINLGFNRVLTSGQSSSADDPKAIELLQSLLIYKNIEIMPGAGITVKNVRKFIDIGCGIVHSSCKKVVVLPTFHCNLKLGTSNKIFVTDESIVREMKELIK